jgi:DNA-binding transcriptional MerR regulator
LLPPPRRRQGRTEDVAFHREHLERLRAIRRGLSMGFSMDDLEAILTSPALLTCNDIYGIAQGAIERVRSEGAKASAPTILKLRARMETSPRSGSKFNCPIYLEIVGPPHKRNPGSGSV